MHGEGPIRNVGPGCIGYFTGKFESLLASAEVRLLVSELSPSVTGEDKGQKREEELTILLVWQRF